MDMFRRNRLTQVADPKTFIGPIDGRRQVVGDKATGNVRPPHVFTRVDPQREIGKDENFGPVLPILKARDASQALELANVSVLIPGRPKSVASDCSLGGGEARGIRNDSLTA